MAVLDSSRTYRNLKKKGFVDSTVKSVDHKYLEFYYNGQLITHTKVSHGSKKDLNDYLIKQMSFQCKLTKQQFMDLAKCPLSEEEYITILIDKGFIEIIDP